MSRFSSFLGGSLYDPNRRVVNNPVGGVTGQAASFAAAEASKRAKEQADQQAAQQAAQQLQSQLASEAAAAESRAQQAQQQAVADQQFRLQQQQFEQQQAIDQARNAEEIQLLRDQETYRRAQQQPTYSQPAQSWGDRQASRIGRAQQGNTFAGASANHSASLRGMRSPFPELRTPGSRRTEEGLALRRAHLAGYQGTAGDFGTAYWSGQDGGLGFGGAGNLITSSTAGRAGGHPLSGTQHQLSNTLSRFS